MSISARWLVTDESAPSRFSGVTIRTALLIGFGLTFGVWLFAGYYFTRRISDVEQRAAAINARYMQRRREKLAALRRAYRDQQNTRATAPRFVARVATVLEHHLHGGQP